MINILKKQLQCINKAFFLFNVILYYELICRCESVVERRPRIKSWFDFQSEHIQAQVAGSIPSRGRAVAANQ